MNEITFHMQKCNKAAPLDKKMDIYCEKHPLITWSLIFIGMPIATLLSVAICTCIFALPFLLIY